MKVGIKHQSINQSFYVPIATISRIKYYPCLHVRSSCIRFQVNNLCSQGKKNIDLSSVKYGIWYLLASLKKMSLAKHELFHFGMYLFQSTRQCLKKMVSHTVLINIYITIQFVFKMVWVVDYHRHLNFILECWLAVNLLVQL